MSAYYCIMSSPVIRSHPQYECFKCNAATLVILSALLRADMLFSIRNDWCAYWLFSSLCVTRTRCAYTLLLIYIDIMILYESVAPRCVSLCSWEELWTSAHDWKQAMENSAHIFRCRWNTDRDIFQQARDGWFSFHIGLAAVVCTLSNLLYIALMSRGTTQFAILDFWF